MPIGALFSSGDQMFHQQPTNSINADIESTASEYNLEPISLKNHQKYSQTNEELIYNIQNGIDSQKSKEILIKKNQGLVYKIASRCTFDVPLEDKLQYGYIALLEAAEKFDLKLNYKFSTYAQKTINNNIYRNASNDNYMIAIPAYLQLDAITVNRYYDQYIQKHHREPLYEVASYETGVAISRIKSIRTMKHHVLSFDTPLSDDESSEMTLKEIISSDENDYNLNESIFDRSFDETIQDILSSLNEHERSLFNMMYCPHTGEKRHLDEIFAMKPLDTKGQPIHSKTTLFRRCTGLMEKIQKMQKR